jgi:kelch-like protein 19
MAEAAPGSRHHGANCQHFTIAQNTQDTLAMLNAFRQKGILCDISLRAESEMFVAHRVVLAAVSPYFKAMFCNNMVECGMTEVPLQGVRADGLRMIIDFAYTSELCISESNVCMLLSAGVMYQMSHVVDACCTFLECQLDPTNCIGIADFAHAHGCCQLYQQAREYIYRHFTEVSRGEEFLQLSLSQVTQWIRRDELNVRCEVEVYEAVLRWVGHDINRRRPKLEQLLNAVRCHFLSPSFLSAQLKSSEILAAAPQRCRDYLNSVISVLATHQPCVERRRRLCDPASAVYVFGGYLRHSLASVECWVPNTGCWYRLASLPTPRSGVSACQIHGKIYVVGGRNNTPDVGNVDSPAVDCFDPSTNTWTSCSEMSVARNRVGVAALDCLVYAVGGSSGRTHHNSVERYDPEKDTWSAVACMETCRIGVGVAVVNRLLYAVGGYDGIHRLSSVECYHPEDDRWQYVAPMSVTRSGAGVCSLDQFIYAVGGYDGTSQLSSVERYSIETNQWQTIASMHLPRSALSLCAINTKICAIGGYDGANFLSSIECYDPACDNWTDAASMPCGRSGHGVALGVEPSNEYITQCGGSNT